MDKLTLVEQSKKLLEFHREITNFYVEYAKLKGLTFTSMGVLYVLFEGNANTQKSISQYLGLPKQTVNAIIKGFNKSGIIEPPVEFGTDKRNKIINLTPYGREFSQDVFEKMKQIEYKALDSLGDEKRAKLLSIIEMYKNNLKMI